MQSFHDTLNEVSHDGEAAGLDPGRSRNFPCSSRAYERGVHAMNTIPSAAPRRCPAPRRAVIANAKGL